MTRLAAFAIPGDITTVTGGYIYERRLLEELRVIGHDVQHVQLGASFPDPTPGDMNHAVEVLVGLPSERALILDGLVYGSIDTQGLAQVSAPIVAMIHHPLALETGLSKARRDHMYQTECDNLSLAAHVLVPSSHTADILVRDYGVARARITIAQPGTEPRIGVSAPSDPPLILSVGIQHPRKGHDTLLSALARVTDQPWRAVIVGSVHDPHHAMEIAHLLIELGLQSRVTITGRIPQAKLDALFAEASIFALATRYEGYGMVFDEALSWGLPIVTCRTGAVPRTVPHAAGLMGRVDAPDEFALNLRRLLTDPALHARMSEAAARAGAVLPTWQDTARAASSVLDAL